MKKILLSILIAAGSFANAQNYTITDLDLVPYANNSVFVFDNIGTPDNFHSEAKLHFVLNNISDAPIKMYGEVSQITNADGSLTQFCFGTDCYFGVSQGTKYPMAGVIIQPNSNNGFYDYFLNTNDANSPAEYKFRFMEVDANDNEIANSSFYITYRYDVDGGMGVSDASASKAIAEVAPSVAKGFTNAILKENASVQILNLEGKAVKSFNLNAGSSKIDLSGLSAGVYFIQFKGVSGVVTTNKVIVK